MNEINIIENIEIDIPANYIQNNNSAILNGSNSIIFCTSNDAQFGVNGKLTYQFCIINAGQITDILQLLENNDKRKKILDLFGKYFIIDRINDKGKIRTYPLSKKIKSGYICENNIMKVPKNILKEVFWMVVYDNILMSWSIRIVENWLAFLKKIKLPKLNRVFPTLLTTDIVGIQPMNAPIGKVFSLKCSYNNIPMGVNLYKKQKMPEVLLSEIKIEPYYMLISRLSAYLATSKI